jgi:hypothetical protein
MFKQRGSKRRRTQYYKPFCCFSRRKTIRVERRVIRRVTRREKRHTDIFFQKSQEKGGIRQ